MEKAEILSTTFLGSRPEILFFLVPSIAPQEHITGAEALECRSKHIGKPLLVGCIAVSGLRDGVQLAMRLPSERPARYCDKPLSVCSTRMKMDSCIGMSNRAT